MLCLYLVSASLLLLSLLLPLHVPPWVSWHNELAAAGALLLPCTIALFFLRSGARVRKVLLPIPAMPAVLLASIALLQVCSGTIAYWGSFWTIAFYCTIGMIAASVGYAAITAEAQKSRERHEEYYSTSVALTVLAGVFLSGGIVQVFLVLSQTLGLWENSDWIARTVYQTRGSGNLAQPNHAALLFVMSAASALYLQRGDRIGVGLTVALLIFICAGLSITESRSGLFAFSGLMAWWAYAHARPLGLLLSISMMSAAILTLTILYIAWPTAISMFWIVDKANDINLTTSGRIEMWRQLFQAALQHPWLGWGVMQVAQAQNTVAHRYEAVMATTFSHNLLMDISLWAGIPVASATLLAMCTWSVRRFSIVQSQHDWYCMSLILAMAIQSFTEFPYAYAYFLFPLFFALGALDASLGLVRGFVIDYRWGIVIFLATLAGWVWASMEYIEVEEDFRVARFEALRIGKVPAAYEQPQIILLTQLEALLTGTRIRPAPGMSHQDIQLLKRVAMLYPWAPTKFRYLAALALNGQLDEARRQLTIVRIMHGEAAYTAVEQRLVEMSEDYPVLKELRAVKPDIYKQ